MKIPLGTSYLTAYSDYVPHGQKGHHKQCDICFLWYAGWGVHIFRFLFLKFLLWESPRLAKGTMPEHGGTHGK